MRPSLEVCCAPPQAGGLGVGSKAPLPRTVIALLLCGRLGLSVWRAFHLLELLRLRFAQYHALTHASVEDAGPKIVHPKDKVRYF